MKCKLAWSHLDFKPGGYAPCYRFKLHNGHQFGGVPEIPDANSSEWKRVRQQLMNDEWPDECVDCRIQEENGIRSYRQRSEDLLVSEPDYNNTEVVVRDLQLKLNRGCNYSCRHCTVASNSNFIKVGKQNPEVGQKLWTDHHFDHVIERHDHQIDIPTPEVIDYLFENTLPTVERIEFSGGEPFFHVEMYRFLERMIADPNIDTSKITIIYNTNMSITRFKNYDIVELWEHFKRADITVSMDGTGDLFNYFRQGGDYETVIENIHDMLNRTDKIEKLLLVCTTTAYHAFYMNEISNDLFHLKEDLERHYGVEVKYRTTFVHWPEGLDIVNLAEDTKKKILENLTYNDFTREFEMRLTHGKRTIPEETFKEIVKLQDQLYNRDASELAPRIFDYVY
jgi:MoaA/NifB/PqqE/SkfB family radical SAM enzyme